MIITAACPFKSSIRSQGTRRSLKWTRVCSVYNSCAKLADFSHFNIFTAVLIFASFENAATDVASATGKNVTTNVIAQDNTQ